MKEKNIHGMIAKKSSTSCNTNENTIIIMKSTQMYQRAKELTWTLQPSLEGGDYQKKPPSIQPK